jgi:hypothetical protein
MSTHLSAGIREVTDLILARDNVSAEEVSYEIIPNRSKWMQNNFVPLFRFLPY